MAQPVDLSVYRTEEPAAGRAASPDPAPGVLQAGAAAWLLEAARLTGDGEAQAALAACRRALAEWPDPRCLVAALPDLVAAGLDEAEQEALLRRMLVLGEDAELANRLAGLLCRQGRLEAALPFLRQAAPALGHRDAALWNYTSALAATGGFHELLAIEPMLVRLAADVPPPFAPFAHLAAARLALRPRSLSAATELGLVRAGGGWLEAGEVTLRLGSAIRERRPFSVVMLSEAQARLSVYASLEAQLTVSEAEMSAVVNSVWQPCFGAVIEAHGTVASARIARLHAAAVASADLVGLPDERHLAVADQSGFLAFSQEIVLHVPGRSCTGLGVLGEIHDTMPFLRPLLAELPFLGFVGSYPDLAARLGRFCHVGETASWRIPAGLDRLDLDPALRDGPSYPELLDQTLAAIRIPYPGAVVLVAAGLLGTACCGLIRAQGGIAIDIDRLAARWMAR